MATPAISRIIVNARIRTGDPRRPWADAAALTGETIVSLGSSAEIRKLAPDAPALDAHGVELGVDDLPHYAGD